MKTKILLVDDHEVVIDGLKAILNQVDCFEIVGEAYSGEECLDKIRDIKPEMVLMDIDLPELNGIVTTRRIKSKFPEIQVAILSIYSNKNIVMEALKSGACGYILKCEPSDKILAALKLIREGNKYVSPALNEYLFEYILNPDRNGTQNKNDLISTRELEIIQLIANGNSAKEIGTKLNISPRTVETHRSNIMRKLGVHSIAELVKYAIQEGIVQIKKL